MNRIPLDAFPFQNIIFLSTKTHKINLKSRAEIVKNLQGTELSTTDCYLFISVVRFKL